jgi:hypothetical protein
MWNINLMQIEKYCEKQVKLRVGHIQKGEDTKKGHIQKKEVKK